MSEFYNKTGERDSVCATSIPMPMRGLAGTPHGLSGHTEKCGLWMDVELPSFKAKSRPGSRLFAVLSQISVRP